MKFMIYLLSSFFLLVTTCCFAQTNSEGSVTNWGDMVFGARMSVSLTNCVITSGATVQAQCQLENTTTNTIGVRHCGYPVLECKVTLTDESGKSHRLNLNDLPPDVLMNYVMGVDPHEVYHWETPVHVDSSILPGKYALKISRDIYQNEKTRRVISSNVLGIEVK
jgi:hypothetical protein